MVPPGFSVLSITVLAINMYRHTGRRVNRRSLVVLMVVMYVNDIDLLPSLGIPSPPLGQEVHKQYPGFQGYLEQDHSGNRGT